MMAKQLQNNDRPIGHPGSRFDFAGGAWGILFLNMGGPATTADVKEYLYNIFSDANIIRLPLSALLQKPLARLIAARRAPAVAARYAAIGGGSPLLRWSQKVADEVAAELARRSFHPRAYVGMRYAPPSIPEAMERAVGEGCRHLVMVSLYPQYCRATTGTALAVARDWLHHAPVDLAVSTIEEWHDRPEYIALLRQRIEAALSTVESGRAKVIFSAHAVPQKLVRAGDPYLEQVKQTAALAGQGLDYLLTFQSRTGPVAWVGPDTVMVVKELASRGVTDMVIVPVSFVSDHIETLHEIDIELRDVAMKAGVKRFVRTESLNDDPAFIRFLATLIEEHIHEG